MLARSSAGEARTRTPDDAASDVGLLLELGSLGYTDAWNLQRQLVSLRRAGQVPDTLVLLEHPPTYTIGRSGSRTSVLIDDSTREELGIALHEVDRGGDATYHGPGQTVGYTIMDLRPRGGDVHAHLRAIEEILLRTLSDFGIAGERDGAFTGVWVGPDKVAAIGVKVTGGVSSHGFALNVDPDFEHWAGILPCGIAGRGVTSLGRLLGAPPPQQEVRAALARHAGAILSLRWRRPTECDLPPLLGSRVGGTVT